MKPATAWCLRGAAAAGDVCGAGGLLADRGGPDRRVAVSGPLAGQRARGSSSATWANWPPPPAARPRRRCADLPPAWRSAC